MALYLLDTVVNPEAGVQRLPGPPPGMGGPGRPPRAPVMEPPPGGGAMARRLDSLEGKTVYLVDTGFGGGYQFMLRLQKWFAEHMPSVKTIRRRKPGNVFMDDNNTLWEEVKQKGDAVVLGVAG
ncbi:MAG: hypothetical protein N2506_02215 [Dehalococcoidales bacterium]|nr:hypothetical protein [Dehalococcoidales bacterium]